MAFSPGGQVAGKAYLLLLCVIWLLFRYFLISKVDRVLLFPYNQKIGGCQDGLRRLSRVFVEIFIYINVLSFK